MANQSIPSGTSVPIEVTPLIDKATLALKTGVAVKMKVRRKSDGFAFDWNDLTFKLLASVTTLLSPNFVEIDATDFPGEYALLFDLAAYSGLNTQDVYEFTLVESGASDVSNLPQVGEIRTGDPVDVGSISGDSGAADNLEATYDGTGYENPVAPSQQQQLDQIALTGAAINEPANANSTITTGSTVSGDVTETAPLDGTYWQIQDTAGTLDMYFEFLIPADGVPTTVTQTGRLNSANDDLDVFAWNWSGAAWEQVGTYAGQGNAADSARTYNLFTTHVGTGADLGKVRIRFLGVGLTSANFYTDQIFLSYAVVTRSVGYADGAVWIDTINGTAGTIPFINGTADRPVLTLADGITLAISLGLSRFRIASGSVITFVSAQDGRVYVGSRWTLALGGQSISGSMIVGATVSGMCTGAVSPRFVDCVFGFVTLPATQARNCGIAGGIILTDAGAYIFEQCYSAVAGTGTPFVDFGVAVLDTQLNMRHHSGGTEVRNMGQAGTDTMSLEGQGQIIAAASCTGGTIAVRGPFTRIDNSGGAVTFVDDARLTRSEIVTAVLSGMAIDVRITIPPLERPAAVGTEPYDLLVEVRTPTGVLFDPDSNVLNVAAATQAGTDRSSNLSSSTMTRTVTGRYRVTYNVANTHEIEELVFTFTFDASTVAQTFEETETVIDATDTFTPIEASGMDPDRL